MSFSPKTQSAEASEAGMKRRKPFKGYSPKRNPGIRGRGSLDVSAHSFSRHDDVKKKFRAGLNSSGKDLLI